MKGRGGIHPDLDIALAFKLVFLLINSVLCSGFRMTDLNDLPIEQKIGQLFVIGIPGTELDEETLRLIDDVRPGGICLFSRNIREAEQTRRLTSAIRERIEILPVIAVDQEGGLVDRLRRIITPMPGADRFRSGRDAAEMGAIIAETLLTLGINVDFAPVVDIADDSRRQASNGLASRIYGRSKEETAELAGAFLSDLQANGVIGCLKHFPGLGASKIDSHEELPTVDIEEPFLHSIDLHPYREMIASGNVHAVMVAHAAFTGSALQETDQSGKLLPTSLSFNFVTKLLRRELGFSGLVITDDLEMGAIVKNYGIGDACKLAIAAGVDMISICADPVLIREGYRSVKDAVATGEIKSERIDLAMNRITHFKSLLSQPTKFDSSRLEGLSGRIAGLTGRLSRS